MAAMAGVLARPVGASRCQWRSAWRVSVGARGCETAPDKDKYRGRCGPDRHKWASRTVPGAVQPSKREPWVP